MTNKIRESIKTGILLVLFLAAILFLYLLWPDGANGFSFFGASSITDETQSKEYELYELISPEKVMVNSQDSRVGYIDTKSLVFQRALVQIQNMCKENESGVASISADTFDEARDSYQSVSMSFSYEIKFSEFSNYEELKTGSNFDMIKSFDTIMFSSAYKSSVFFKNSQTGECYRLAGKSYALSIDDLLQGVEYDGNKYIQSKYIMGQGESFIPYGVDKKIKSASVSTKVLTSAESESLARVLFGKSFDFARKVVDTVGNITYMYGYGQKVLKINKSGELEYRAELSEKNKNSVLEDLSVTKEFVDSLSLEKINGFEFVLEKIVEGVEENSAVRRFEYVQYHNNLRVKNGNDSAALIIEVENGQIVNFIQKAITLGTEIEPMSSTIYEPARMLAENCVRIYQNINGDAPRDSELAYSYVCENIETVNVVYVQDNNRITPYWNLSISGKSLQYGYY